MIPVVAISKALLTDLLQILANSGLYPTWAVAEPLLLPWKENELSILLGMQTAIVRDSEVSGFECAISQLPTLLKCHELEKDSLSAIRIWNKDNEIDVNNLFDDSKDKIVYENYISDFDHYTEFGLKHPVINILQGFDALDSMQSTSGSWRPAIALTLGALLLYFATSGYQYFSLQQELQVVSQQTEELFRKAFPDVKRVVQPLVQAQQKLDQRMASNGQSRDDLLALLLALGEAKQINKEVEFKNLEYRQKIMVVHLEGKSVAKIEEFKQQLESNGNTTTNILSTVSKENKVEARIRIKAKSV
jgi:type II secretory pathway component PulL